MEDDFIREMEARPGEALPALVFADWLEEHGGKPAHAELIRLHHQSPLNRPGGRRSTEGETWGTEPAWESAAPDPSLSYHDYGKRASIIRRFKTSTGQHQITFRANLPQPEATLLHKALKEEMTPPRIQRLTQRG